MFPYLLYQSFSALRLSEHVTVVLSGNSFQGVQVCVEISPVVLCRVPDFSLCRCRVLYCVWYYQMDFPSGSRKRFR